VVLTPENWEAETKDRTIFVKFFAPWCGHCKKIKPDWDRLTADFEGAPSALIGEVDCTSSGKTLCEKFGITGFPRLMWGKGDNLEQYSGARNYNELKEFADDFIGTSCGPGALDSCEPEKRKLLEKIMEMSDDKLEAKIKSFEKIKADAETAFMDVQWNMSLLMDKAEMKKEKRIKAITEGGLGEAKKVDAWNRKHGRVGNLTEYEKSLADGDEDGVAGFLQDVVMEIGGAQVTGMDVLLSTAVIATLLVGMQLKKNAGPPIPRCRVRHILSDEEGCYEALERINAGEEFPKVAFDCSMCPSGQASNGSVGPFSPGSATPEFEKVCFDPETKIGQVMGPIATPNGFHLIVVEERTGIVEKPAKDAKNGKKETAKSK